MMEILIVQGNLPVLVLDPGLRLPTPHQWLTTVLRLNNTIGKLGKERQQLDALCHLSNRFSVLSTLPQSDILLNCQKISKSGPGDMPPKH